MTEHNLPPVLGFTGAAGSGKSTAATWVLRNHNMAQRMTFAEPIKRMTREFLRAILPKNWDYDSASYVSDPVLKETPIPFIGGMTARHLMQTLGTEWGRQTLHEDFWVGIMASKLERMMGSSFKNASSVPIKAVFDDIRFANEAALVRLYGGPVVRIERPGYTKPDDVAGHPSESMKFDADLTIVNDGTVEDLEAKLAALFPPLPKPEKKKKA